MIRDRRTFHAVAFQSSLIKSLSDIKKLLPSKLFSIVENISGNNPTIDVEHIYYYSKTRYSPSPELDEIIIKHDSDEYYAYSLYLLGYLSTNEYTTLIAGPFLLLLKDVFEWVRHEVLGKGIKYRQVNIQELVEAIKKNRHLGGLVKLTDVEMMITADDAAKIIALRGPNIIHSNIYDNLQDALEDTGITLSPRKCCILYDDHEGRRFSLTTDKFGNFSFRVGKDGRNLPWSGILFSYLTDELLIRDTLAFPPDRQIDEELNGLYE